MNMQITLYFDRLTTGELEPFAHCMYSDMAEVLARKVVDTYGWPVVVKSDTIEPKSARYFMGKVEVTGVLEESPWVGRVSGQRGTSEASGSGVSPNGTPDARDRDEGAGTPK